MNLPRLAPGAIRHDKLDRSRVLTDERPIEFASVGTGEKEQGSILQRQKIAQVERFPAFTANPHLAVSQRTKRQQTGIAAARELAMMND